MDMITNQVVCILLTFTDGDEDWCVRPLFCAPVLLNHGLFIQHPSNYKRRPHLFSSPYQLSEVSYVISLRLCLPPDIAPDVYFGKNAPVMDKSAKFPEIDFDFMRLY